MNKGMKSFFQTSSVKTKIIFVLGAVGVFILLLSELMPNSGEKKKEPETSALSLDETDKYRQSLEKQLKEIISQIDGAGKAEVMITIGGTEEHIYAEQGDIDRQNDSGRDAVKQKNEIILADIDNDKQPVLRKVVSPEIKGAIVVCDGGSNPQTKERIMNAVSAALGIPFNKISVEPSA